MTQSANLNTSHLNITLFAGTRSTSPQPTNRSFIPSNTNLESIELSALSDSKKTEPIHTNITFYTILACAIGITACILFISYTCRKHCCCGASNNDYVKKKSGGSSASYLESPYSINNRSSDIDCDIAATTDTHIPSPRLEICEDVNSAQVYSKDASITSSESHRMRNKIQEYIMRELKEIENFSHGRYSVYNRSVKVKVIEEHKTIESTPRYQQQDSVVNDHNDEDHDDEDDDDDDMPVMRNGEISSPIMIDVFSDIEEPGSLPPDKLITNGIRSDEFIVNDQDVGENSHDIITKGGDYENNTTAGHGEVDSEHEEEELEVEYADDIVNGDTTLGLAGIGSWNSDCDVVLDIDFQTKGFIKIEDDHN